MAENKNPFTTNQEAVTLGGWAAASRGRGNCIVDAWNIRQAGVTITYNVPINAESLGRSIEWFFLSGDRAHHLAEEVYP
jgi:hypothetical protein